MARTSFGSGVGSGKVAPIGDNLSDVGGGILVSLASACTYTSKMMSRVMILRLLLNLSRHQ